MLLPFSAELLFYFAILENLRIFQNCLFTGGVITESGSCRAGFLWKHSRGGINVLPASTSLSSTTPAHENGVQKHPQAFLDPKIKNIISLAYAQSNAERIQNHFTCPRIPNRPLPSSSIWERGGEYCHNQTQGSSCSGLRGSIASFDPFT